MPCVSLAELPGEFSVCRLERLPALPLSGVFFLARTAGEISYVCEAGFEPEDAAAERGWRALAVEGPLKFELTGVVASLAGALAKAGIPIFAVSTYDTDTILVKSSRLSDAARALSSAGHRVDLQRPEVSP